MKTRINGIGFEIEGEFTETVSNILAGKGEMKGDGSIEKCNNASEEHNPDTAWHYKNEDDDLFDNEYNSPVYNYSDKKDMLKLKRFFEWLQNKHENGEFHWNESMGFHIHFSFRPKIPPEIVSSQFANYFLRGLKTYHPDVMEIRSNNSFCKSDNTNDKDIAWGQDRYKFINFAPSLSRHGTIEFRIFPSNEPKEMWSYMQFTIRRIESFLKRKLSVKLEGEIEEIIPEKTIEHTQETPDSIKYNEFASEVALKQELEINR
jgi:hypothetical protein